MECTYARETKKRGPKVGYVEKLHHRIKELEGTKPPIGSQGNAHDETVPGDNIASRLPPLPIPERTIQLDLLERFFVTAHLNHAVLDKDTFMCNVVEQSPLLLNAMYTVAHAFAENSPDVKGAAVKAGFVKCRSLLLDALDKYSCSNVYALSLLCAASMGQNDVSLARTFLSMATNMAIQMQLHRDSLDLLPPKEEELRKRVWIYLFQLDSYLQMIAPSVPFLTQVEDMSLALPNADIYLKKLVEDSRANGVANVPLEGSDAYDRWYMVSKQLTNDLAVDAISIHSIFRNIAHHNMMINGWRSQPIEFVEYHAFKILEIQLNEWYSVKPVYFKNAPIAYSKDLFDPTRPIWEVAHQQIMYFLTRLTLQDEPFRQTSVQEAYGMTQYANEPKLWDCIDSARSIAHIVQVLYESNLLIPYMVDPMTPIGISRAGHVMLVDVRSRYFTGAELNETYVYLVILNNALTQLATAWPVAGQISYELVSKTRECFESVVKSAEQ